MTFKLILFYPPDNFDVKVTEILIILVVNWNLTIFADQFLFSNFIFICSKTFYKYTW